MTAAQIEAHNAKVARDAQACRHPSNFISEGTTRIQMVYGSAPTQVCRCGAWRTNLHVPGKWRTDSIEEAEKDNGDENFDTQAALKASRTRVSTLPTNERMALAEASKAKPVRNPNEECPKMPSPCAQDSPGMAAAAARAISGGSELLKTPRSMNKTERRFADLLDAKKQTGEVLDWRYEGMRLKWGGEMHYTADFVVFGTRENGLPLLIEVKGAHVYSRDIVRFKGCRAEWPQFAFEMHQFAKGTWTRKY